METRGFSVRIFIPSGEPEGLRVVEKSNWTGQGLVFPRALLPEARRRPELGRTGVYILWGPGESSLPRAYVGEGDGVLSRLDMHGRRKDFWTHAVVFTSKDQNLNKAHVQYLEARLVELATAAKRAELDNGNVPQQPALSEADVADAEAFLADMLLCLPIVGVTLFERAKAAQRARADVLTLQGKGIDGRGVDGPEGFVVLTGSTAARSEAPSIPPHLTELRRVLLGRGVLLEAGEVYRVVQDYTFGSPSTAAGVLLGRSVNGRKEWKDAAGRTLKELQDAAVGVEEQGGA